MSEPTVVCVYFKQELPALATAPIPGELGEQIRTQVSQAGWEAWLRVERAYVTHFELDPRSNEYVNRRQLVIREFFFGLPEMNASSSVSSLVLHSLVLYALPFLDTLACVSTTKYLSVHGPSGQPKNDSSSITTD